jgi:ABC-type multidrug transport system ATPase subunit
VSFDFDRLVVDDVSRHFGRRKALNRVNLTCTAGEIVGLLGPNGAGKSTLLSILSTLVTPSTGKVLYGDRTADQAGPALRARLGLLGHDLYLYPGIDRAREPRVLCQAVRPAGLLCAGRGGADARQPRRPCR